MTTQRLPAPLRTDPSSASTAASGRIVANAETRNASTSRSASVTSVRSAFSSAATRPCLARATSPARRTRSSSASSGGRPIAVIMAWPLLLRQQPLPLPALEPPLGEELLLEADVELRLEDVDRRLRSSRQRLYLHLVRERDRADRAHLALS